MNKKKLTIQKKKKGKQKMSYLFLISMGSVQRLPKGKKQKK